MVHMGSTLADFRASQKLSSEEMADTLCISQSTYSKYETGKLPVPLQVVINITKEYKTTQLLKEWYNGIIDQGFNALITA